MNYCLDFAASGNAHYVTVPEISLVAGDVIEVAVKDFADKNGSGRFLYDSSNPTNALRCYQYIRNSTGNILDSSDHENQLGAVVDGFPFEFLQFPTDGEIHTIRNETSRSCTITHIGASDSNTSIWNAKLVHFKIIRNDVVIHHYDPSASNATGSILYDVVGGNDGTIVNAPLDDSHWSFLEDETAGPYNVQNFNAVTSGLYTPADVENSMLVVLVAREDVGNNNPIGPVTFGGATMTESALSEGVVSSNSNDVGIYTLANPTLGEQTILINGSNERNGFVALTLGDVASVGPSAVDDNSSDNNWTLAHSLTTTEDNALVLSVTNNSANTATAIDPNAESVTAMSVSSTMWVTAFLEEVPTAGAVNVTSTGFSLRSSMASLAFYPVVEAGGGRIIDVVAETSETSLESNERQVTLSLGLVNETSETSLESNERQVTLSVALVSETSETLNESDEFAVEDISTVTLVAETSETSLESNEHQAILSLALLPEQSQSLSQSNEFTIGDVSTVTLVAETSQALNQSSEHQVTLSLGLVSETSESLSQSSEFAIDDASTITLVAETSESLSQSSERIVTVSLQLTSGNSESLNQSTIAIVTHQYNLISSPSQLLGESAIFSITTLGPTDLIPLVSQSVSQSDVFNIEYTRVDKTLSNLFLIRLED